MGWIVIGIVIVVAVITTVSQVLKGQQEAVPPRRPRPRPLQNGGSRPPSNDIDRFLQEIDRLRKRPAEAAAPPPRPKARATAAPARPAVPVVEPVRPRRSEPSARTDELPVATVVPSARSTPGPVPAQPPGGTIAGLGRVATSSSRKGPQTPFAKSLVGLLTSPQTMPMAVVLREVLGPPKCKPPHGGGTAAAGG